MSGLEKERSLHANTTFYCQELTRKLKEVKWKFSELAEQKKQLLVDRVDMKEKNERLKKAVTTLQSQVEDMHKKTMELIRAGDALEKESA